MSSRAVLARHARGFTLVELMVAMVAGLFVSIAVFTLAKHSSAFSMRQTRIADATLQSVVGFERLKSDIARAGFLSTPNLAGDPAICRDTTSATYPLWLRRLASIYIEPSANASEESTVNGLAPSSVVLAGSYASSDQFPARNIISGPPVQVFLVPNSLGMVNIGYPAAPTAATLSRVFATDRALRIVDDVGRVQFGVIAGVTGGANPSISLALDPAIEFKGSNSLHCGISGHGKNLVNVVNIVRYDLRNLHDPPVARFAHMFRGGPAYEVNRRELIREEYDTTGAVIPDTLELIAEYAVDLGFSLLVEDSPTGALTRHSGADVADFAGNPTALLPNGPQMIRAVHAWLSVRSQEADRESGLELTTTAPGPSLLRISLNPLDRTLPPFARVRTLQSTIPLTNQARASW